MKKRTVFTITGIFVILFVLIFSLELRKISRWAPNAWTTSPRADCAVVLTGDNLRIQEGMDLLAKAYVKKLIISGVNPGSSLLQIFPQWFAYGLKKEDVVLEKFSKTTYGNGVQSLALAEALNCNDLILVTSHFHMYRALKIFTSLFPEDKFIYPRAVISSQLHTRPWKLFVETTKSLFYELWAY